MAWNRHSVRTRLTTTVGVVTIGAVLIGTPPTHAQIRLEPDALNQVPSELLQRLRAGAYDYFRFVNRPWITRVCDVFSDVIPDLPIVHLHGDAHIEQFAVTRDGWGLDDFDDSTRGPALVDIVRFLGSTDLAARQRGWSASLETLFNRFFDGYYRGRAHPRSRPREPAFVRHLRALAPRSPDAFLTWGEAQMAPMDDASLKAAAAGLAAIGRRLYRDRPDLPRRYFEVVRAGWLRIGVGSAVTAKVLMRVQGPSLDPSDDELIEAKEARYLGDLGCIHEAPSQTVHHVIVGNRQLGRLRQNILSAGPELTMPDTMIKGRELRDWWVRSWDASYREVGVKDLRSVTDLADIVYDAGLQLGAGSVQETQDASTLKQNEKSLRRLEPRIRQEALRLVDELMLGWKTLQAP